MAEVHQSIITDKSGNQVVFHSPGLVPSNPLSGTAVTATKTASGSNATVQGQVATGNASTIIFSNPS
jgi:hypothetical protein